MESSTNSTKRKKEVQVLLAARKWEKRIGRLPRYALLYEDRILLAAIRKLEN